MTNQFLTKQLGALYEDLRHGCRYGKSTCLSNGLITFEGQPGYANTEYILGLLRFDDLKQMHRAAEITLDSSCRLKLCRSNGMEARELWNDLVSAAHLANNGLLVIHVRDLVFFSECWMLKQLAKQEGTLEAWEPFERNQPQTVDFRGSVILSLEGINWEQVSEYAREQNSGEFEAMMQFYSPLELDDAPEAIVTKYNIDDTVWYISGNCVHGVKVKGIRIEGKLGDDGEPHYTVNYDLDTCWFAEDELFATKQELLNTL